MPTRAKKKVKVKEEKKPILPYVTVATLIVVAGILSFGVRGKNQSASVGMLPDNSTTVTLQYGRSIPELNISTYTGAKDVGIDAEAPNAGYYQRGAADGISYRFKRIGLYWFDLSAIPQTAVISDARLILYSIPGQYNFNEAGSVPIYLAHTLPPNDNVIWSEGSGTDFYAQYKGTSWSAKDSVDGEKPRFPWSSNPGLTGVGDLSSTYQGNPVGNMNFQKNIGAQQSDNLSAAINEIIKNNYKYEGFVVDRSVLDGDTGRQDNVATKEYSDITKRPALLITYSLPASQAPTPTPGATPFVTSTPANSPTPGVSSSPTPTSTAAAPITLLLDNSDTASVKTIGTWTISKAVQPFNGPNYLHDGNTGKGTKKVVFTPNFQVPGWYNVYLSYSTYSNRSSNTPVDIISNSGLKTLLVNQRINGGWNSVGTYFFNAGTAGNVTIRTDNSNGYVIADAVKFVPVSSPTPTPITTPTPTVKPTLTPSPTTTPTDTPVPSGYIIEKVEDVPLAQTTKKIFPAPSLLPEPGKCQSVIDPNTGVKVTRISDVGDTKSALDANYPYDGYPGRGFMDGYSKYATENYTGQYVIAYGVQPWINKLYDTQTCQAINTLSHPYVDGYGVKRQSGLGETWDVRWDLSGRPGTTNTIYYASGGKVYSQDVLNSASEQIIYDFSKDANFARPGLLIGSEGHMDQDNNAHYRGVRLWDTNSSWSNIVLLDMWQKKVIFTLPYRTMFDVSPSGQWFFYTQYSSTGKQTFWMREIATGREVQVPVTTNVGHDGWSYDKDGNEVYLYQDNGNDYFAAFDPAHNVRTNIINMSEMGWSLGQHTSRIMNPATRGWMIMGSYVCEDPRTPYAAKDKSWAYNQIMMFEIKSHEQHPRIWRVSSNFNSWCWPVYKADGTPQTDGDTLKTTYYFAEAFPNFNYNSNHIYVGANWFAKDNLELYRIELPQDWQQKLNGTSPIPTPVLNTGATQIINNTKTSSVGWKFWSSLKNMFAGVIFSTRSQ